MSDDKILLTQEELVSLLGRSLSSIEITNFNLYQQIAVLRLNDLLCIKIEDLDVIPDDLKLLLARIFGVVSSEQQDTANRGINKKQVEDFSISYEANTTSPMEAFVKQNATIIDKYGMCQGRIRSGKVIHGDCFRCI